MATNSTRSTSRGNASRTTTVRPKARSSRQPQSDKPDAKPRFWHWFRAVPLVILLMCFVVAVIFKALPGVIARNSVAPVRYAEQIQQASTRHKVDPYLVCAIIKCESGWDPVAESRVGAQGLMQVMPSTASELVRMGLVDGSAYPPDDLLDPTTNIEYGCAYLGFLTAQLDNLDARIAAYNAGIGQVLKWQAEAARDGKPFREHINYAETFAYVSNVNVAYHEYAQYYPEGITS